jgi:hypothetical protein
MRECVRLDHAAEFPRLNEDGFHAQAVAEFDVGERIADHDAGFGGKIGKLGRGLLEKAGKRLAAVALLFVVRAEVEGVYVGAAGFQEVLQGCVHVLHIGGRVEPQRNAALVGDNHDAQARPVEAGDGFRHAGQQVKLVPAGHVAAFRHLFVQHSVAVEEYSIQVTRKGTLGGVLHFAIITIGMMAPDALLSTRRSRPGSGRRLGTGRETDGCMNF